MVPSFFNVCRMADSKSAHEIAKDFRSYKPTEDEMYDFELSRHARRQIRESNERIDRDIYIYSDHESAKRNYWLARELEREVDGFRGICIPYLGSKTVSLQVRPV